MGNRGNIQRTKIAKWIKFVCPECGCLRAECVEVNATVTSEIMSIVKEGDFNYHAPIIGASDVDSFGCVQCNFSAKNKDGELITDNIEFAQWCLDNCSQT
jgi:hypothetical protein